MANNTIEILTSINKTVSTIASYMAPKNASGKEGTAKLSKGNLSVTDDIDPSKSMKGANLSTDSLKDFVKILGDLPVSVKKVAGMSGKTINNFQNVMNTIIKIMAEIDEKGKKIDKENIKVILLAADDINKITGKFAKVALIAPVATIGALATYPVIMTYLGLIKLIDKFGVKNSTVNTVKKLTKAVKPMIRLVEESVLLFGMCTVLGLLVMNESSRKVLFAGLTTLGGVLLALTAIIGVVGLAGRLLKNVGAIKGIKEITVLTVVSAGLVAMCLALGALVATGDTQKILLNGLAVLGGTLVTLTVMILLVGLAGRIIKEVGAMKAVRDIVIMTLATMSIIVVAGLLGDHVMKNYESILIGLAATTTVLLGLVGIGALAGKLLRTAKRGISALAVIEVLALGAMGIVYVAAKVSQEIDEAGGYGAIAGTVLAAIGIVTAFGALATAASFIMPEILLGSVALGVAELMAFGAIKLIGEIIELNKLKEETGTSWKQVAKDVLGICGVVGAFGLIAGAFSLLTIPITLAIPAMALTTAFAFSAIAVVKDVIDITNSIKDAGGIEVINKTMNKDVPSIMKGFNMKNFKIDMSLFEIEKYTIKIGALARLSASIVESAELISKLARIGKMTDGGLRPMLAIDPTTGEIKYGDPVDIPGVASMIVSTMKIFVDSMDYGFKDLKKMFVGAVMFEILGTIATPVSTFINMLTGFVSGSDASGNFTLAPVRVDEKGEVKVGHPVAVRDTAINIVNAVSAFVKELYSPENAATWSEYVYGDRTGWQKFWGGTNTKTKSIGEIGGLLGLFVAPAAEFIELVAKFESKGNGHLAIVSTDSEGKPVVTGDVDVKAIASIISGGISSFIKGIYGGITEKDIDEYDDKNEFLESLVDKVGNVGKMFETLSTAKIDEKKINDLYTHFRSGADAATKFGTSLMTLDRIINREHEKRKKNIKEIGDAIKEMVDNFEDDGKIKYLYSLLVKLENVDTSRINDNMRSINGNIPNINASSGSAGSGAGSSVLGRVSNNRYNGPTATDIADAIKSAIAGLKLSGGTKNMARTSNPDYDDLIAALSQIEFDITND